MAYKINNTFGTLLVSLADGTIDVATTDLTLIGKGYAGFGEKLNENLVKLLENFHNTSAPNNKIQGQLWFDQTNKQINVYDGTKFKPVGSPTPSTSQPANAVLGDEWFDTNNSQFYIYNGASWTLIGPTTIAGTGQTVFTADSVEDNTGQLRSILKMIANDAVVGIVSNIAFTPSSTATSGTTLVTAGFSHSCTRCYTFIKRSVGKIQRYCNRFRFIRWSCGGKLFEIRHQRYNNRIIRCFK